MSRPRYVAPKGIANHPGVEACESGDAGGSDYKHEVFLREGWSFDEGRMRLSRFGMFHSVEDFKAARPTRRIVRIEP